MAVNIDTLIITTPLAKSASDPLALEVTGAQALATLPQVVRRLDDGAVRLGQSSGVEAAHCGGHEAATVLARDHGRLP